MQNIVGSNPPRYPPNTMHVSKEDTFYLTVKRPLEGLRLLRWLLTKFYSRKRKFEDGELEVLFLLSEYFLKLRNKGFFDKHGLEFLKLRRLAELTLKPTLERHEEAQEQLLLQARVLMNPRVLRSLPKNYHRKFLSRENRRLKRPHPEQRRIGVGYRDKGSTSDPAQDGSPQWREVAVSTDVRNGVIRSEHKRWWESEVFFR